MRIKRIIKSQLQKLRKENEEIIVPIQFYYNIDEPYTSLIDDYRLRIRGWVVPTNGEKITKLQIKNNNRIYQVKYGIRRKDVAKALNLEKTKYAEYCGFDVGIEFEEGSLTLEAIIDNQAVIVKDMDIKYLGTSPLLRYYVPEMADKWAEHKTLLQDKKSFYYETEIEKQFRLSPSDKKLVAFYLPQFHPIAENDKAWGKGFTEWSNVASAEPRFVGHHQPTLPADLGYYDLRMKDTIVSQVKLAQDHGIYGFSFYYYWFSGHRLLEKPLDIFLKNKDIDMPFMICWANENWTRRWDGMEKDVIIAQKYLESDPLDFIKDVEPILLDKRYIRVDNKPVLAVYRPEQFKDYQKYVSVWRDYFKKNHGLELHLINYMSFKNNDPADYGFDASVDFMPQGIDFKAQVFGGVAPHVDIRDRLLDPTFSGVAFDYRKIVLNEEFQSFTYPFKTYKCVMPSWDNDARKKGKGSSYYLSSPDLYGKWLDRALTDTDDGSLVFINAWNEWAEGAMLEPTERYGHAVLNRTAQIMARHSHNKSNQKNFPLYQLERRPEIATAVVVHLFYPDLWAEISKRLKKLKYIKFDLFVTLPKNNSDFENTIRKTFPDAKIFLVPNRGRDILPFMHASRRISQLGYSHVLKIHTKKSKHRTDGQKWFLEMLDALIPTTVDTEKRLLSVLGKKPTMIGPSRHYISMKKYMGGNENDLSHILSAVYNKDFSHKIITSQEERGYFAGSMFWMSASILQKLTDMHALPEDFPPENKQVDGTFAHAIERAFTIIAEQEAEEIYQINKQGKVTQVSEKHIDNDYRFV